MQGRVPNRANLSRQGGHDGVGYAPDGHRHTQYIHPHACVSRYTRMHMSARTHGVHESARTCVHKHKYTHGHTNACSRPRRLFLHFSFARRRSSTSPTWQVTSPWPSHSQICLWRRTSLHHHRQVSLADAANLQVMPRVFSKTAILTPARPRVGVPYLVRSPKRPPGQSGYPLGAFAPRPIRTSVHSHLGF